MHKLATSPDNVGGVARIVAIPVYSFTKVSFNYITRRRTLSLSSTDDCIEIECNRNEEVSDNQNSNDEGITYLHQLTGKIFSLDMVRNSYLDILSQGKWLLLVTTSNNITRLYGSPDTPLVFTYKDTSGKHKASSSVQYTFSSSQRRPALLIDNSPL